MFSCNDQKPKRLDASVKPTHPKLIKDTQTIIPPPVALETVQDFSEGFIVALTDSLNPHRFWFTPYVNYRKLNELTVEMNAFYSANKALKIDEADIQEGLFVAASFSSLWNRAKIIGKSDKFVRLFYVDYGTTEDVVADDRVRYLREDFAMPPSFALRGVLSHVQPVGGAWSEESSKFFMSKLYKQKLEVKIFKKNIEDSSYSMAIRAVLGEEKKKQLVSDALITKKFCIFDKDFLEKSVVNEAERSFNDLEAGKNLKSPKIVAKKSEESWLPSPTVENVFVQSTADSIDIDSTFKPLKVPSANSSSSKNVSPSTSGLSQMSTSSATEAYGVEKNSIPEQNMSELKVGASMKVYIHVVNDLDQLFFYRKSEFLDIRSYLKTFK